MKGSNVLTPEEKEVIFGSDKEGIPSIVLKRIEEKLKKYQGTLTDSTHIQRVNSCIPQGAELAMVKTESGDMVKDVKKYVRAMNRITRAKGLRC
jgi:Tol biopolymer transport system component